MKYTNSYGISINLEPWFSSGFRFTKLHMFEELGGLIAMGTMDLEFDGSEKSLKLITDQQTGNLTVGKEEDGNIYEIEIFITKKKFYNNYITISFICIKDNKFLTQLVSTDFSDIDTALRSLYPGKTDIRCESDIANELKILQNCETNYSLCTKLAYSYRKNVVFSFGWEGLMIKEVIGIDSGGNKEPYWNLLGNVDAFQIDSYNLVYNKLLYHEPKDPWVDNELDKNYSEYSSKNCRAVQDYASYRLVGKSYSTLVENFWNNQRFSDSDLFTSFRIVINDLPNYKIGDLLYYKQEDLDSALPFSIFLVKSNELFVTLEGTSDVDSNGFSFSWTSKLIGIENNGEVLSTTDPT